jgi:hypothetical protein
MTLSALDSALLGPLFATDAMRAVFADEARVAAILGGERHQFGVARGEPVLGHPDIVLEARAHGPRGPSNAELVSLAAEMVTRHNRKVATAAEARAQLHLKPVARAHGVGPAGERPAHDAGLLAADAGGGPGRARDATTARSRPRRRPAPSST